MQISCLLIARMKTYILVIVLLIECISEINSLLHERDACETINHEPGICVRLELCPFVKKLLKKNLHPSNCGFVHDVPIVCCPLNATKYTYVARKKCDKFERERFFLLNGINANTKELPHMAALGYNFNNDIIWLCGGTLINRYFVLTAAHCLNSLEFGPVQRVRMGSVNIINPGFKEDYGIIKRIKHPLYKPPSVYHDLGLLQLDSPVYIHAFVQPACLYTEDIIPQDKLLAAGWGITKVGGNQSKILQKASLDLFNEEECNLTYNIASSKRRLKYGILYEQQICAGGKKIGTDTCQGDSGGPLFFKQEVPEPNLAKFYVVGVTSFGKSCGFVNVPGIYTRVSYYVPWIESVIWPNETSY